MKQPQLGLKIIELRKTKGLTQEELVEKCNLNVRTLQRIEAGEVNIFIMSHLPLGGGPVSFAVCTVATFDKRGCISIAPHSNAGKMATFPYPNSGRS